MPAVDTLADAIEHFRSALPGRTLRLEVQPGGYRAEVVGSDTGVSFRKDCPATAVRKATMRALGVPEEEVRRAAHG